MSGAQHTPGPRLSSAQLFLIKEALSPDSRVFVSGRYARTRYALQDMGLVTFNEQRGKYQITESGRAAMERANHALETSRSGAQSGYASGRCKCGWSYSGWTDRAREVRNSFERHVDAAIAKATGRAA